MSGDHAHGGRRPKRRDPVAKEGGCRVTELFQILGKAHTLDILHVFHADPTPRRFVEIQERLGVSPNTLAERLRELVDAGLLTRTAYNEIPPRVDYAPTEKAAALEPAFATLTDWASQHDLRRAPPSAVRAST